MVKQYDIFWTILDPTQGSEINKTRPCVIISPNISNKHLNTVLIAPITSTIRNLPMRINVLIKGKQGQVCFDQIRCIDKIRLPNKITALKRNEIETLKEVLKEYLIDN